MIFSASEMVLQINIFLHNTWFKSKILTTGVNSVQRWANIEKQYLLYQEILNVESWLSKLCCFPDD